MRKFFAAMAMVLATAAIGFGQEFEQEGEKEERLWIPKTFTMLLEIKGAEWEIGFGGGDLFFRVEGTNEWWALRSAKSVSFRMTAPGKPALALPTETTDWPLSIFPVKVFRNGQKVINQNHKNKSVIRVRFNGKQAVDSDLGWAPVPATSAKEMVMEMEEVGLPHPFQDRAKGSKVMVTLPNKEVATLTLAPSTRDDQEGIVKRGDKSLKVTLVYGSDAMELTVKDTDQWYGYIEENEDGTFVFVPEKAEEKAAEEEEENLQGGSFAEEPTEE